MSFSGTNSGVIVPSSSGLNLKHTGTVAFWEKNVDSIGTYPSVVCNSNCFSGSGNNYGIYYSKTSNNYFLHIGKNGSGYNEGNVHRPADSNWHFIVGTWDGSALWFYVDTVPTKVANQTIDSAASSGITMMQGSGQYMTGSLDDVRIYNRALTPADVTALYHNGGPTVLRNIRIGHAVIR